MIVMRRYCSKNSVIWFGFCILLLLFIEAVTGFNETWYNATLRLIVSCIFVFCIYMGFHQEYIINAYLLFSITPLSLLIYSDSFSKIYLKPLNATTWVFAIINMIAFLGGYILSAKSKQRHLSIGTLKLYDTSDEETVIDNGRLKLHSIILCILGTIPSITYLLTHITLPLSSIIGFFVYIGIAFAFRSKSKAHILFALSLAGIGFIQDFNKTRLMYLLITMLLCIEIYIAETKRQRLKYMFFGVIASVGLLLISFPLKTFLRSGGNWLSFFQNTEEISASTLVYYNNRFNFSGPSFLRMPYMYMVQGWNNLQYVMQTQDSRTYGMWLIKPLIGYLQMDKIFASYYELTPSSEFNTYTYMAVHFKDFGFYGSVIGSTIIGSYVKHIVRRIHTDCSAFVTATSAMVLVATLEMFFSNHFFSLSYPFTIVIISFIYMKIFRLDGY